MPPRKKANNKVNEEVENKIKSFVNTANEKDCESSDEEYNIYVKSARAELPERRAIDKGLIEPTPPSGARAEKVVKSKKAPRIKIVPVEPIDPADEIRRSNEKLYKMFDEYKNELNELRNIVAPHETKHPKIENITPPTPTPVIDVRRAMMQLKFG